MSLLLPFLCPHSAATWSLFLEEKRKTPAAAGTQDKQWAMFGFSSISKRKWKSRTLLPAAIMQTVSGLYDEGGFKERLIENHGSCAKTVTTDYS